MTTENNFKYLHGPTNDQIRAHIKKLGTNMYQLERFYGIPEGTLTHVLRGARGLPSKFWHLFLGETDKRPDKKTPRKLPIRKLETTANPSSKMTEKFKF